MMKDSGVLENSLLILKQVLVTNRKYVNEESENIEQSIGYVLELILLHLEQIEDTIPSLKDNTKLSLLNII